MTIQDRIAAFSRLGERIAKDIGSQTPFGQTIAQAHIHNPWFTKEFCKHAIGSIAREWLTTQALAGWIESYSSHNLSPTAPKTVAVIMAGNVPFVGFHDMLCVLMSGHRFLGKISSKDGGLMQALVNLLLEVEPRFTPYIRLTEGQIKEFDAVIATGSDNSARYFEHYFGKYPHIIRQNRHSIAVLSQSTTQEEMKLLGQDIFLYFGLGCRNVSKVLIPTDFRIENLLDALLSYTEIIAHHKYANNYEYHRAVYLMNQIEHLDTGFLLVKPDEGLGSPVGVLFYQRYNSIETVKDYISVHKNQIQCVVSSINGIENSIAFGQTQNPQLTDYADGIDTLQFLGSL